MSAQETPSTVVFSAGVLPGYRTGARNELYPNYKPLETWIAEGGITDDRPYDIFASSTLERDRETSQVTAAYWNVIVHSNEAGKENEHLRIDKPGNGNVNLQESAAYLAQTVEQYIGRASIILMS